MFFGEFLIEKKIITTDRLLVGLVWQFEKQSSVLRILAETQFVTKQQILKIAKISWETKKDILQVGRELAILNDSQVEQVIEKQRQSRKLIGEMLVEIGAIGSDDLDGLLVQYQEQKALIASVGHAKLAPKEPPPTVTTEKPAASNRLEEIETEFSTIPWQSIEPSMAVEYSDFLDANKVGELEAILLGWERDRKADYLRSYFREIHTLKGTARFVKAFLSEKIIHKMEELVSDMIRVSAFIQDDHATKFVDILLKGLDVLSAIKEEIVESLSESDFYEVKSNKKIIISYSAVLADMLAVCKTLEENIDLDKLEDQF